MILSLVIVKDVSFKGRDDWSRFNYSVKPRRTRDETAGFPAVRCFYFLTGISKKLVFYNGSGSKRMAT
jgi:hypothetical protein